MARPSGERSRGELKEDGAGVAWRQCLYRRVDDVGRRMARCLGTFGGGSGLLSQTRPLTGLEELVGAREGAIELEGGNEASPWVEDPVGDAQAVPAHPHQPRRFCTLCPGCIAGTPKLCPHRELEVVANLFSALV